MSIGLKTADDGASGFAREVTWTVATRVCIAASSVLASLMVARWLGPSGAGVLATISVISMLAITFGGLGMPLAVTFLVARERRTTKPILINGVAFGFVFGTVLAAAVLAVTAMAPGILGDVPPLLVAIAIAALPFQLSTSICLAIYLGLQRIRTYNQIDLALQGLLLINAFVMLLVLGSGLPGMIVFGAAANIIAGLIILSLLGRSVSPTDGRWRFDYPLMREMLGAGGRFLMAMAAGLIVLRGDLLFVNYFRGTEEAGVYAVSTQIATFLHLMPNVISTLLFPRTARADDATGHMTCRVTRHAVLIVFTLCMAAIPLALLVPFVYGPGFAAVPTQFVILLPGIFLLGIETVLVQYFTGLGLPRLIPVFWIVTMTANIGLNITLVPRFGAEGAAVASTVSYALIFGLVAAFFHLRTGRSLGETFIIRRSEVAGLLHFGRTPVSGR